MAHPNEEIVRKASDTLVARDMETFMGYQHEDVVVHSPRGDLRGHDAIRKNFQEMDAMLDGPSQREVHDILANDRHAIVLATEHMTKGDTTFNAQQVAVIHLQDGKA